MIYKVPNNIRNLNIYLVSELTHFKCIKNITICDTELYTAIIKLVNSKFI